MTQLQGKVVLITGATGGLGRAVVRKAAETDARLALTVRRLDALQELAGQLKLADERTLLHAADLAIPEEAQALVDAVVARWGGVDILLNVAGGWSGGKRLADTSDQEWQSALNRNLTTTFLINRAVLPSMLKRGWGRIVNVGSKAAEQPRPRQAAYNVAKAGVVALTQSIAAEYRRQGITANVLLPSIIDTAENREQMPDGDFSRWVKPDELAATMLFLCSDEAASINGASIRVYGGV
jgi:NAD(P)-dependent dehydrogenase (short-subunit alcohol dehydrogenase family)